MRKRTTVKLDPIVQAYRRILEADDPWLREEYQAEYEALLRPPAPQPLRTIDDVKADRAERQREIYKP